MVPGRERADSSLLCTAMKLAPALLGVGVVVVAWAFFVVCRRWRSRRAEADKLAEKQDHEIQNQVETTLLLGGSQDFNPSAELWDKLAQTRNQAEKCATSPGEDLTALGQDGGLPGLVGRIGEELKLGGISENELCHKEHLGEQHESGGYQHLDDGQCGEPGAEGSGNEPERVLGSAYVGESRQILESSERTEKNVPDLDGCEHEGQHSSFHSLVEAGNETACDERNALINQVYHCDFVKDSVEVAMEVCKGHCEVGVDYSPSGHGLLYRHHGDHLVDAAHGNTVHSMEHRGHGFLDGEVGKRIMAVPPMPQVVEVHFRVHYVTGSPWQQLAVTGSVPELGCWSSFVALDAAPAGFWARSVALPADSQVEWKFVLVENGKIQRWEECENRHLDTTGNRNLQLHRWWGFL